MASMRPGTSRRIPWQEIPAGVAAAIEHLLGGTVATAVTEPDGFSKGLAARVRLTDGRRAFVKAANVLADPAATAFHRREIAVTTALAGTGATPELIGSYDDGTWAALAFEEIPGRLPAQPWQRDELDRVLDALTVLAGTLTPAPVDAGLLAPPRLGGWRALSREGAATDRLRRISPWAAGHLSELAALDDHGAAATTGRTLLHGDQYHFNVMLTPDRVRLVDWPHAWIGAPHCDVLTLLSSTQLSGIDPRPLADRHPLTRDLDPLTLNATLALHAGFLLRAAACAGPSADPVIVAMMIRLGNASVRWLRKRL
jgi:aminoglycoside phosphotransferase